MSSKEMGGCEEHAGSLQRNPSNVKDDIGVNSFTALYQIF